MCELQERMKKVKKEMEKVSTEVRHDEEYIYGKALGNIEAINYEMMYSQENLAYCLNVNLEDVGNQQDELLTYFKEYVKEVCKEFKDIFVVPVRTSEQLGECLDWEWFDDSMSLSGKKAIFRELFKNEEPKGLGKLKEFLKIGYNNRRLEEMPKMASQSIIERWNYLNTAIDGMLIVEEIEGDIVCREVYEENNKVFLRLKNNIFLEIEYSFENGVRMFLGGEEVDVLEIGRKIKRIENEVSEIVADGNMDFFIKKPKNYNMFVQIIDNGTGILFTYACGSFDDRRFKLIWENGKIKIVIYKNDKKYLLETFVEKINAEIYEELQSKELERMVYGPEINYWMNEAIGIAAEWENYEITSGLIAKFIKALYEKMERFDLMTMENATIDFVLPASNTKDGQVGITVNEDINVLIDGEEVEYFETRVEMVRCLQDKNLEKYNFIKKHYENYLK